MNQVSVVVVVGGGGGAGVVVVVVVVGKLHRPYLGKKKENKSST